MEYADIEQLKTKDVAKLLALVETERRYYQAIVAGIHRKVERLTAAGAAPERVSMDLANSLDALVWVADIATSTFSFVNPKAEAAFGYPAQNWLNSSALWTRRIHSDDRERVLSIYRAAADGLTQAPFEYRAVSAAGHTFWLRESVSALADVEGAPKQVVAIAMDVSERRELEEQNVQSQRNQALVKLASRLAHDFNNLLMIIMGYSEELMREFSEADPRRADVREILTATDRVSLLTSQLLAFTRRQAQPVQELDLSLLMNEVVPKLRKSLGEAVAINVHLGTESNYVRADARQLEQVITVLTTFAAQSGGASRPVSIETGDRVLHECLQGCYSTLQPGHYATIAVKAPSFGMDCDARASVFEPLFTSVDPGTDPATRMSRVYSIVKQWEGDIAIASEPDSGTIFTVHLPLGSAIVQLTEPERPVVETVVKPTADTILVIEDEAGIRSLMRKILLRQGYDVLEADSAEEALRICADSPGKIGLLVTDITLPEMNGPSLVEEVTKTCPEIRVLYISGYTNDATVYNEQSPRTAFLQKPFTSGSLLDKVKEILLAGKPS